MTLRWRFIKEDRILLISILNPYANHAVYSFFIKKKLIEANVDELENIVEKFKNLFNMGKLCQMMKKEN